MFESKGESKGMHFARVEKSARLQRVLEVLGDGRAHTTLWIQNEAKVCAVGSIIGELRKNGFDIECKYRCMTAEGGRVYTYRLKKGGEEAA